MSAGRTGDDSGQVGHDKELNSVDRGGRASNGAGGGERGGEGQALDRGESAGSGGGLMGGGERLLSERLAELQSTLERKFQRDNELLESLTRSRRMPSQHQVSTCLV